ncbi:polysaccharide lyase family 8 super-sandwich domain-containing protein [Paenibacillus caseinilyticus]|uniref:polysaccharide lyase family 8 super-sandwich domain-containing protein n=1 Tax=Paenibacillus mucilaginosus TaxID=61624 RepID=UPI0005A2DE56|nr:polysaccharide lyase family 8 super-sandwich domain-containing protein [Paenibacillus mucilaginosus]
MKPGWKKVWTGLLVCCLLLGSFGGPTAPAAAADEYDTLRIKWESLLTGEPGYNTADPDIAAQISAVTGAARTHWNTMNKTAGRTALWSDLADWSQSATITASYSRLKSMAAAYGTTGSELEGDAGLAADIVSALDWMYANTYNETKSETGNWWDWEIGTPLLLGDIMVLVYDRLSEAQKANYIKAIDKFCPDPAKRTITPAITETGANRLDKALINALRGTVGKSSAKLAQGRDAMSQTFLYVSDGDGFYRDGSFVQHNDVAYTGSYGLVMLGDLAKLLYLLQGSSWSVTDANLANVYNWVEEAYRPLIYQGAMMDMVRGRAISRSESEDHTAGRSAAVSIVRLAQGAPQDKALAFRRIAKSWMQADRTFANYYAGLAIYDIVRMKALVADTTLAPAAPLAKSHMFAGMDRYVHHGSGFAFGLSLFSSRISAFEYINGENSKGWYTGAGMTFLYNGDQAQYAGNYWPTVNMIRLPGTTTDGYAPALPVNSKHYLGTKSWAGGSSLSDAYGSAGMEFSMSAVTGSTLQGKKSWFVFGDRIAALGAEISASDGRRVETVIENRKLASGTAALTVNGTAKPASAPWSEAMTGVRWAHLAGPAADSGIGYYFPSASTVQGQREQRTGSWNGINSGQSSAAVTNTFASLAVDHGVNPTAGSYAYVLLPNRDAAAVSAFAASPTVQVLSNTAAVQAVRDTAAKAVGANFWNDAAAAVNVDGAPWITSDKKASVTTVEAGKELSIAVSDPTQANTGEIRIEIGRSAAGVISADPLVTVTRLSPTVQLTVKPGGTLGRSLRVKLSLPGVIGSAADAYVRDGSYAGTNYGADGSLVVKLDAAGYQRQSYLRFDLASVTAPVTSAKLRLVPTQTGMAGMTNEAHLVSDTAWGESTLTWNSRPAAGALIGSWTVPAAGTPLEIDVTGQVNAALSAGGKLSIRLSAPANSGADGYVNYASKESGTAPSRPQLLIVP